MWVINLQLYNMVSRQLTVTNSISFNYTENHPCMPKCFICNACTSELTWKNIDSVQNAHIATSHISMYDARVFILPETDTAFTWDMRHHSKYYYENPFWGFFSHQRWIEEDFLPFILQQHCNIISKANLRTVCPNTENLVLGSAQKKLLLLLCALCACVCVCIWFSDQNVL